MPDINIEEHLRQQDATTRSLYANGGKFPFDDHPNVLAILGSRSFMREGWIYNFVGRLKPGTIIVSGGAKKYDPKLKRFIGADYWAKHATLEREDLFYKEFPVDAFEWEKLGKHAGHLRNEVLLTYIKLCGGWPIWFIESAASGHTTPGSQQGISLAHKWGMTYFTYEDIY